MTRFQFVADHRSAFEVKRMCQLLQISQGSFYAWAAAADARAARQAADKELAGRIRAGCTPPSRPTARTGRRG